MLRQNLMRPSLQLASRAARCTALVTRTPSVRALATLVDPRKNFSQDFGDHSWRMHTQRSNLNARMFACFPKDV